MGGGREWWVCRGRGKKGMAVCRERKRRSRREDEEDKRWWVCRKRMRRRVGGSSDKWRMPENERWRWEFVFGKDRMFTEGKERVLKKCTL